MAKVEKEPLNFVHQNAILCETINKETRHQKLYTDYSVNPFKKSKYPNVLRTLRRKHVISDVYNILVEYRSLVPENRAIHWACIYIYIYIYIYILCQCDIVYYIYI